LGATDEELKETMTIAMTVGATKIQILQGTSSSGISKKESSEIPVKQGEKHSANQEACTA
jgi:hypothetical protein